ncbi:MAG: 3-hydroxyacyl-CoA dehydrogenase [Gammaproteobacteria bacterium]|jgi:3-hydroxyacyl-CoA dehydrogenase|nr:3-hydroxyacyl-CoA dehydrogenase [Gammaproteobacteria bacterium]
MFIRKAAVLGAGVMGAQIAAHLVNAGIPTLLFDLPAKEGDANSIVLKAIANLKKLKPTPLGVPSIADFIIPANYHDDLTKLSDCDFIIEAVAERIDIKESLYQKIAPFIHADAIVGSNTSGLSIETLASVLPNSLKPNFCGVHFFNPPRYMTLVEITPHLTTNPAIMDQLETFLTSALGKGVIRAKDTPNFIANRIGVFSILAMMHRAVEMQIPFEVVDQLSGKDFGRAKSALFRTLDVVGIDVLGHVIQTMTDQLKDDPWHPYYQVPEFLKDLIAQGKLGQKSGAGIYQKVGKNIQVYDLATKSYREASQQADAEVLAILKIKDPNQRLKKLRESTHPQAQFLWLSLSDLFYYCAYHVADIAHNVRDLDLAMRWGFGWREGPFELWQLAGFSDILAFVKEDITQGKALVKVALPNWLDQVKAVYQTNVAYDPEQNTFVGRSKLPVYARQLFPAPVLDESFNEGETWYETEVVRLWTLDQQVGILSFKSKNNTIGDDVLDGVLAAVKIAEEKAKALVIWQRQGDHFSYGANLKQVGETFTKFGPDAVRPVVEKFQRASQALRFATIPVVAAVKGMVLGGSCEFLLHCDRVVAAFESYIGLVEVGVGLLPAGAGCKEFALRAFQEARGDNPYRDMVAYFKQIAMGEVSSSAMDAKSRGYLRASDIIVMNPYEVLYVALQQASAMAATGYRPPMPARIPVIGKPGIADFEMMLVNMLKGQFISEYDFNIAMKIATILCGGMIEAGSVVDEAWYLKMEVDYFMELLQNPKTQARVKQMLETGKPLRN